MTTDSNPISAADAGALRERVQALQATLRQMEEERLRLRRKRRQELMIVALAISVVVHVGLMVYLASKYRAGQGTGGPAPVQYEFAILNEETLTELEALELQDADAEAASALADLPEALAEAALEPAVSAAELELGTSGALPSLGGSGGGELGGAGLSGAGAGASFFGVSSRGQRFAYIVDRSGSMGEDRKMRIAMRELARSVGSLPDYASFYVILFSSEVTEPTFQRGWTQARRANVNRLIRWLNDVDPDGGTTPMPAFHRVFGLETRPDVIFFLTDGRIPNHKTPEFVRELNRNGKKVVINTIAFGDPSSQDLLKQIAADAGGVYRFVDTGAP